MDLEFNNVAPICEPLARSKRSSVCIDWKQQSHVLLIQLDIREPHWDYVHALEIDSRPALHLFLNISITMYKVMPTPSLQGTIGNPRCLCSSSGG